MVCVFFFFSFQGDMVEYRLERGNSTVFELVPDSDEAVTASMTQNIMNCGFAPSFDRFVIHYCCCRCWGGVVVVFTLMFLLRQCMLVGLRLKHMLEGRRPHCCCCFLRCLLLPFSPLLASENGRLVFYSTPRTRDALTPPETKQKQTQA